VAGEDYLSGDLPGLPNQAIHAEQGLRSIGCRFPAPLVRRYAAFEDELGQADAKSAYAAFSLEFLCVLSSGDHTANDPEAIAMSQRQG
jgi:hypothetical protein